MRYKDVLLWIVCAGVAGWLFYATDECAQHTEGTDMYWACVTGEAIDLGVQDEVDSSISKGRD